jgi:hypothetical protein
MLNMETKALIYMVVIPHLWNITKADVCDQTVENKAGKKISDVQ